MAKRKDAPAPVIVKETKKTLPKKKVKKGKK